MTGGFLIMKPATALGSQANSAVALGMIGTGNRGAFVGNFFVRDPRTRLVAMCDINPEKIDHAKTVIPNSDKTPVIKDHAELLARADIDAVYIATPVYLHPEHFEAAAKARKHIYCEKPAGADAAGVKRLLRAAQQADKTKHMQFGFQQRHSPEYLAAEKDLRAGAIGDLVHMRSYWLSGGRKEPAPAAPPTEEEKKRNWYPWVKYCGDIIVEQHCHGVDVLNWFSKAHPLKAAGVGGRTKRRQLGDRMDHLDVTYTYPGGIHGHLEGIQMAPRGVGDVKETFWGMDGMIETHRRHYTLAREGEKVKTVNSKREITIDAVEHFLTCVVAGKPENEAPWVCESTFTSLLGRMAIYEKREVAWEEMMRGVRAQRIPSR